MKNNYPVILNDFRPSIVLRTYDELIKNNMYNLVQGAQSLSHEKAINLPFLMLYYDPFLHTLRIERIPTDEPIYPNPDAVLTIMPIEAFKKTVSTGKPDCFYNE